MKSNILVGIQFACIGWLLFTGHLLAMPPWIWLELTGLGILAWAVVTMKPHRVSPLPEIRPNTKLVTRGPYRWIRHPMYTGVLLTMGALVLDQWTIGRAGVWIIILADLVIKLHYEEGLLRERFPEYATYQQQTRKLFPFVY